MKSNVSQMRLNVVSRAEEKSASTLAVHHDGERPRPSARILEAQKILREVLLDEPNFPLLGQVQETIEIIQIELGSLAGNQTLFELWIQDGE